MDILQKDKDFKAAVGAFIIAFSQLEFGLAFLCSMTEFDLRKKDAHLVKYLGYSFDQKLKLLTEFIDMHMIEIKPIWDILKGKISQVNRERRFIAHGFMTYYLPNESISTFIKEKGQMVPKKQTTEEINKLTDKLHHLNTGEYGINGEFHTLFTKHRVDQWNGLVNDDAKIIYQVNSKIISEWKGKNG